MNEPDADAHPDAPPCPFPMFRLVAHLQLQEGRGKWLSLTGALMLCPAPPHTHSVLPMLCSYKKGELEGKNVSMLMPNPFQQRHDTFLKNYNKTGKAQPYGKR